MDIQLQANIQWKAAQMPASGRWVAICEPMNMTLEADSLDELNGVIAEALHLLFLDLLEDNEFDAYLTQHGWTAIKPPHVQGGDVRFQVPWELIASNQLDSKHMSY